MSRDYNHKCVSKQRESQIRMMLPPQSSPRPIRRKMPPSYSASLQNTSTALNSPAFPRTKPDAAAADFPVMPLKPQPLPQHHYAAKLEPKGTSFRKPTSAPFAAESHTVAEPADTLQSMIAPMIEMMYGRELGDMCATFVETIVHRNKTFYSDASPPVSPIPQVPQQQQQHYYEPALKSAGDTAAAAAAQYGIDIRVPRIPKRLTEIVNVKEFLLGFGAIGKWVYEATHREAWEVPNWQDPTTFNSNIYPNAEWASELARRVQTDTDAGGTLGANLQTFLNTFCSGFDTYGQSCVLPLLKAAFDYYKYAVLFANQTDTLRQCRLTSPAWQSTHFGWDMEPWNRSSGGGSSADLPDATDAPTDTTTGSNTRKERPIANLLIMGPTVPEDVTMAVAHGHDVLHYKLRRSILKLKVLPLIASGHLHSASPTQLDTLSAHLGVPLDEIRSVILKTGLPIPNALEHIAGSRISDVPQHTVEEPGPDVSPTPAQPPAGVSIPQQPSLDDLFIHDALRTAELNDAYLTRVIDCHRYFDILAEVNALLHPKGQSPTSYRHHHHKTKDSPPSSSGDSQDLAASHHLPSPYPNVYDMTQMDQLNVVLEVLVFMRVVFHDFITAPSRSPRTPQASSTDSSNIAEHLQEPVLTSPSAQSAIGGRTRPLSDLKGNKNLSQFLRDNFDLAQATGDDLGKVKKELDVFIKESDCPPLASDLGITEILNNTMAITTRGYGPDMQVSGLTTSAYDWGVIYKNLLEIFIDENDGTFRFLGTTHDVFRSFFDDSGTLSSPYDFAHVLFTLINVTTNDVSKLPLVTAFTNQHTASEHSEEFFVELHKQIKSNGRVHESLVGILDKATNKRSTQDNIAAAEARKRTLHQLTQKTLLTLLIQKFHAYVQSDDNDVKTQMNTLNATIREFIGKRDLYPKVMKERNKLVGLFIAYLTKSDRPEECLMAIVLKKLIPDEKRPGGSGYHKPLTTYNQFESTPMPARTFASWCISGLSSLVNLGAVALLVAMPVGVAVETVVSVVETTTQLVTSTVSEEAQAYINTAVGATLGVALCAGVMYQQGRTLGSTLKYCSAVGLGFLAGQIGPPAIEVAMSKMATVVNTLPMPSLQTVGISTLWNNLTSTILPSATVTQYTANFESKTDGNATYIIMPTPNAPISWSPDDDSLRDNLKEYEPAHAKTCDATVESFVSMLGHSPIEGLGNTDVPIAVNNLSNIVYGYLTGPVDLIAQTETLSISTVRAGWERASVLSAFLIHVGRFIYDPSTRSQYVNEADDTSVDRASWIAKESARVIKNIDNSTFCKEYIAKALVHIEGDKSKWEESQNHIGMVALLTETERAHAQYPLDVTSLQMSQLKQKVYDPNVIKHNYTPVSSSNALTAVDTLLGLVAAGPSIMAHKLGALVTSAISNIADMVDFVRGAPAITKYRAQKEYDERLKARLYRVFTTLGYSLGRLPYAAVYLTTLAVNLDVTFIRAGTLVKSGWTNNLGALALWGLPAVAFAGYTLYSKWERMQTETVRNEKLAAKWFGLLGSNSIVPKRMRETVVSSARYISDMYARLSIYGPHLLMSSYFVLHMIGRGLQPVRTDEPEWLSAVIFNFIVYGLSRTADQFSVQVGQLGRAIELFNQYNELEKGLKDEYAAVAELEGEIATLERQKGESAQAGVIELKKKKKRLAHIQSHGKRATAGKIEKELHQILDAMRAVRWGIPEVMRAVRGSKPDGFQEIEDVLNRMASIDRAIKAANLPLNDKGALVPVCTGRCITMMQNQDAWAGIFQSLTAIVTGYSILISSRAVDQNARSMGPAHQSLSKLEAAVRDKSSVFKTILVGASTIQWSFSTLPSIITEFVADKLEALTYYPPPPPSQVDTKKKQ